MLEFEETSEQSMRGTLKHANEGYVVMPIGEYNEMLRRADAAYNAVTLSRREYSKSKPIEATIDKHWLYKLAMDKLAVEYGMAGALTDYVLTPSADDMVLLDVTLAKLPEPTEDEDD